MGPFTTIAAVFRLKHTRIDLEGPILKTICVLLLVTARNLRYSDVLPIFRMFFNLTKRTDG
jgi:hypothetical protein